MADQRRPAQIRCAIYTRKSGEEGLEQDFNSLHAQRGASEAFILSQRHEGWQTLPTAYDDGGFSGGSIERPALQRLLADIAEGQIDVVVVYKIDRLTRSLLDFARIVEIFDKQGVSFVSVTQQFNTTTSMGRLTLNVLLSFAQFEREVTGERIRDKIAASKKKGMWMGGYAPMGYDSKNRSLVVNKAEAETVRTIFNLYLRLKNVRLVQGELARIGLKTKVFSSGAGRKTGGRSFSRGHIYKILSNAIYAGLIEHKGARNAGQHPAIINKAMFEAAQELLAANGHEHRARSRAKEPSLLAGLLFDEHGNRFTATHATKGSKRYRYYELRSDGRPGNKSARALRIAAPEIEQLVVRQVSVFLRDSGRIADVIGKTSPQALKEALAKAEQTAGRLESPISSEIRMAMLEIVAGVALHGTDIRVRIHRQCLFPEDGKRVFQGHQLRFPMDGDTKRVGERASLVLESASGLVGANIPKASLLKSVARGYCWFEELSTGRAVSIKEIADRNGVTDRYVARILEFAFLAPTTVERQLV